MNTERKYSITIYLENGDKEHEGMFTIEEIKKIRATQSPDEHIVVWKELDNGKGTYKLIETNL
jgi:hypothetical protein